MTDKEFTPHYRAVWWQQDIKDICAILERARKRGLDASELLREAGTRDAQRVDAVAEFDLRLRGAIKDQEADHDNEPDLGR